MPNGDHDHYYESAPSSKPPAQIDHTPNPAAAEIIAKEYGRNQSGTVVCIDYTNYRGERAIRRIRPIKIEYESNEWHEERQWLLYATDLDKENAVRTFALENIHSWNSWRNTK